MCGCVPANGIFYNIDGLDCVVSHIAFLHVSVDFCKEDISVSNTGLIIS